MCPPASPAEGKLPLSTRSHKSRSHARSLFGILFLGSIAAYFLLPEVFAAPYTSAGKYKKETTASQKKETKTVAEEEAIITTPLLADIPRYIATPKAVKAIYMTQCVAGTPSFREKLITLADETEINSIMIDIKDFSGGIGFQTENPALLPFVSDRCRADDMRALIARMHEKGIYVIGRITVFQDPLQTKAHPERAVQSASTGGVWKDNKGLSFIDVGTQEHWEYIVELSRESRLLGFDELNYDYVRYPSDGNMKDARFRDMNGRTKAEVLETFFAYLAKRVKDPALYGAGVGVPAISADLFGMTTTNTDDLNIGQVLERALPYFDYVAPMVYPSHYPPNFNGWKNPNSVPYELIHFVMKEGVRRTIATSTPIHWLGGEPIYREEKVSTGTSTTETKKVFTGLYSKPAYDAQKLRPWIQDFDYGGNYDVAEVRAQIKATYDVGLTSWMLWAPSNIYTRGALRVE